MGSTLHVAKPRAETGDRGQGPRRLACEKDEAEIAKEDETDSFWKKPIYLSLAGLPWPNVTRPSFERLPATRPKASTERLSPLRGTTVWKSKRRITQCTPTLITSPSTDWPADDRPLRPMLLQTSVICFQRDELHMLITDNLRSGQLRPNAQDTHPRCLGKPGASFQARPDTPYEVLSENPRSSTSELTVLVCVDGLFGRTVGLLISGFLLSGGCFWAGRHTCRCLPPISRVRTKHRNLDPRACLLALSIPTSKASDGLNPGTACYIADTAVQGKVVNRLTTNCLRE